MMNPGLLTSNTDEWATPQNLFDELNAEFGPFDLDPCANAANAKCHRWFGKTPGGGGLSELWLGKVFMNPPYGREIKAWMKKAYDSSQAGALVVCLVPARTCSAWWHDFAAKGEVRFIRGRVKFGGAKWNAPFPSAIVVFRPAPDKGAKP